MKAATKWDGSATECVCMDVYICSLCIPWSLQTTSYCEELHNMMMNSCTHISMNEDAVMYRIIKEYACKNFWILIISLSLQAECVIDSKINGQSKISQEFLLHSYWKKLG